MEEKLSVNRLKVGTYLKVTKSVEFQMAIDNDECYNSRVVEINKLYLLTTLPSNNGKKIILSKGDKVTCCFTEKDGQYKFETNVLIFTNGFYMFNKPEFIFRIQLRNYIRVPILLPVVFNYDNKGKILNLSSGGVLLNTNILLGLGEEILLNLEELGIKKLTKGLVVRIVDENKYGIKFIEMSEFDKDLIMGYVFRKISQARKKLLS